MYNEYGEEREILFQKNNTLETTERVLDRAIEVSLGIICPDLLSTLDNLERRLEIIIAKTLYNAWTYREPHSILPKSSSAEDDGIPSAPTAKAKTYHHLLKYYSKCEDWHEEDRRRIIDCMKTETGLARTKNNRCCKSEV